MQRGGHPGVAKGQREATPQHARRGCWRQLPDPQQVEAIHGFGHRLVFHQRSRAAGQDHRIVPVRTYRCFAFVVEKQPVIGAWHQWRGER